MFTTLAIVAAKKKELGLTNKIQAAEMKGLPGLAAKAYAKTIATLGPVWGNVAFAAIAAVITALSGVGIAAANGAFEPTKTGADATADEVNKLSNEIYKLNEKANAINKVTSQFDNLNKKVIKTKDDIEEMNSLLESAGDSLSSENEKDSKGEEVEGTSEQDKYAAIQTNEERIKFLKEAEEKAQREADDLRDQQLKHVKDLRSTNRTEFNKLMDEDTSNADYLATQSAVRAIAYDNLYERIDALQDAGVYSTEVLKDVEELTSSLISSMSALEALDYADNEEKMYALVDAIHAVKMEVENNEVSASDIFLDEGKGIKQRLEAYTELRDALEGDAAAFNALKTAYAD